MSELKTFEQRVADVLAAAMGDGAFSGASAEAECIHRTIDRLAPRVAASVQAGIRTAEMIARKLPTNDKTWYGGPEAASLTALRGTDA